MSSRTLVVITWMLMMSAAFSVNAERPTEEAYVLHCSGCHGLDGTGIPGFVPSLRELAGLLEKEGGRAYLARVPGVAQAPLPDRELAALLNWVMEELSGAQNYARYTSGEIGRWRAQPLRDPLGARPE
ncbi:MAG: cytochrome c [Myxococcota bacterium]|jgi:mono/diheme cytochrome c family protein|nr:cytochrome c [Myxococcota bacterium]